MTDQDWQELGRRAVTCRGWRWLPGMLAKGGQWPPARIISIPDNECDPPEVEIAWAWDRGDGGNPTGLYPDLRDPATLGCLLALVREAWGSPQIGMILYDGVASVYDGHYEDGLWIAGDDTEAHALVAALESAPEHTR